MSARLEPYPQVLQPPIIQSPTRNPNFTDLLGTLSIAQLPQFARQTWLSVGDFEFFGGATMEENGTAGAGGLFILLDALNERAKTHVKVPAGAASVAAATLYYVENAELAGTITVYSRSLATTGENANTGGSTDSAAFSTFAETAGNVGIIDVLTAFDALNVGVGDDTLYVEVRLTALTAGGFGLIGLMLEWQ